MMPAGRLHECVGVVLRRLHDLALQPLASRGQRVPAARCEGPVALRGPAAWGQSTCRGVGGSASCGAPAHCAACCCRGAGPGSGRGREREWPGSSRVAVLGLAVGRVPWARLRPSPAIGAPMAAGGGPPVAGGREARESACKRTDAEGRLRPCSRRVLSRPTLIHSVGVATPVGASGCLGAAQQPELFGCSGTCACCGLLGARGPGRPLRLLRWHGAGRAAVYAAARPWRPARANADCTACRSPSWGIACVWTSWPQYHQAGWTEGTPIPPLPCSSVAQSCLRVILACLTSAGRSPLQLCGDVRRARSQAQSAASADTALAAAKPWIHTTWFQDDLSLREHTLDPPGATPTVDSQPNLSTRPSLNRTAPAPISGGWAARRRQGPRPRCAARSA
jgi:hypothetical protein